MGYDSVIKRNKILTLTTVWVNLENIRPSEISPTQKKVCDSTDTRYWEQTVSWKQKVEQVLPGAGTWAQWTVTV